LFDVTEQAASHREMFAILQHDDVLAFEHRLKFFHAVEIDNGASADAQKGFGIELRFERVEGLAQNVAFFAGINTDVVAGGFDRVDVGSLDDGDFVVRLDRQRLSLCGQQAIRAALEQQSLFAESACIPARGRPPL
jgi:hypothetical protein